MVSLEIAILLKQALADFNPAASQYRKFVPRSSNGLHSLFDKMILTFHFQSKALEIETQKPRKFTLKFCSYTSLSRFRIFQSTK